MRRIIDSILEKLLISILTFMVINVVLQVFARFAGISIPFTEELAGFLLMWTGLLGAGYATGKGMHLAIDIFPRKATPENQVKFNWIINGFVILFAFLVMVVGGFRLVYIALSLDQLSPVMQIPKGYVYLVLPFSGIMIVYYSILNIIEGPSQPHETGDTIAEKLN